MHAWATFIIHENFVDKNHILGKFNFKKVLNVNNNSEFEWAYFQF